MQTHLFKKKRGEPDCSGFRGMLTAMLFGTLLFVTGAKAAPLSGTYTIDASGSGNYTSFKLAVADLTTNGVSGRVYFNVTAATYAETVKVGSISGASSTNTITFHGAGRGATFLSTSGTIVTVSAYTIFDGMSIVTSGSTLIKADNSTGCSFTNCNLVGLAGGSSNLISASSSKKLTIYNCEIYGGGTGLYLSGSQGTASYGYLRCSHNRFINQQQECIDMEYDFMDSVAFNVFDSDYNTTSGAGNYMDEAMYSYGANGLIFWGNKVSVNSYDGVDIYDPDEYTVTGSPTQSYFVNNWITIPSTGSNNYEGSNIDLYNNSNFTVAFNTFINDNAQDEALNLNLDQSNGITFSNNIFYGTYNGYDGQFYLNLYSSRIKSFDGNDVYTSGSSSNPLVSYYDGSSFYSFYNYSDYSTAMQAQGWELSGTNVVPPFVNISSYPYDLHMLTTTAAPKGIGGTGITTDIDGKGRFTYPTPGASESYYGIVNNNSGVTAMVSPIATCPGSATVSVAVADLGLNAITSGVTIAWDWNGVTETSVVSSKSIPLYGQDTIVLGTVTLSAGVSYTLKAWPAKTNGATNAGGAIDTLTVTGIMAALGGGTYTIDASKAVSGSNFQSFTDAASALKSGICGAVEFDVSAASYNESITIGAINGSSAANTVLFKGAGRNKTTLTNSGVPITISGSSYVTFDQMAIKTTGNGNVVTDGNSKYCAFINDNLIAPTYTNGSGGDVVITSGSVGLKVHNCRLVGGNYSYYVGSDFDTFTNNRIISMGNCSIYAQNVSGNDYEYNVVDSVDNATPSYGLYSSNESGGNWNANNFNLRDATGVYVKCNDGAEIFDPNETATTAGSSTVPLYWAFTNNILQCAAQQYGNGFYYDAYGAKGADIMAFNTISINNGGYESASIYLENNNSNTQVFANNIFMLQGANYEGYNSYTYSDGIMSGITDWDNANGKGGNALYDGNVVVSTGSGTNWVWGNWNGTLNSYSDYYNVCKGFSPPWQVNGSGTIPNFLNAGPHPLYLDTTKAGPPGVDVCTPVSNSYVNYPGVQYDITGKKRCALFPTAGAYEDPFGKSAIPTKIFVPSSGIFPGSPATIYQSHVAGDPAVYNWYIENSNYSTWTAISDSVDLYYNGWTTGKNSLKLITRSCTGTDSDSVSITVKAPTAVPVTDFIAASNAIQQNTSDLLTDLSTNGPIKWQWTITPDSITVGTSKQATSNLNDGSSPLADTQNPDITFYYPGFYKICLTAYNGLGKGASDCKTNYIQVVPATILGATPQTVTDPTGYIYDNGGPGTGSVGKYTAIASPYIESVLIAPCADSIYLTFSQFDTRCGYDFVNLYNGSSPTQASQINTSCSGGGVSGGGPGFNGGPTNGGCSSYCVPNVNKPDTFKSGPKMLLTMYCYTGGAPGFAAYYWVKPSNDKKVMPSFTTANGSDSVCAGQLVSYKNTTAIDPKDVPSFEWDLNGNISDGFECVGTCATAQWPYFLPGTVPVTLISINCGGQDTLVKNIIVISPPKPVAAFTADIVAPTLTDKVTFTSGTVQCVDAYKWAITASAGSIGGAAAVYLPGSSDTSASPMVTFPDTGYYDVSLTVSNALGTQTDTKTILKYIHVREPYCQPSVAQLSTGIGINHVVFNTIDNYTTPQAASGYLNFTSDASLSTTIAIGASYNLSVSRDPNSIFSAINRDAWIDWNEDGYFTGTGENVLMDSNTTKETSSAKITVPTGAKVGATILRIATNLYLYPNAPCGPNQFGEYQDYRVYITPYNIPPVITLKGKDTIVVEQGYPFADPGDTATSYLYGNMTSKVVVTTAQVAGNSLGATFSILVPGTYLFSYDVTDAAGNKAVTKHRVVIVTPDKTPPNLILAKNAVSGTDTIFQEVSMAINPPNLNPSLLSYVISSIDLVDGDLTGSVSIDSALVQLNAVGVYPVTYTSTDLSRNSVTKTLYVDVIDTIKPVLTINLPNPDTIEVNAPFVDPGVTVSVSNGYLSRAQLLRYLHVTSSVNDSVPGVYKVIYSLTDTFGNIATPVTRVVVVADKLAPVITLLGPVHDSVLVNNTYYDRGYTVSDNYTKTGNITIDESGTFITNFKSKNNFADKLGGGRDSLKVVNPRFKQPVGPAYRLTYTATDQAGNKSSVTRYIEVYDDIAPVISLIGDHVANVCRWFPYMDAGYIVSDNYTDTAHLNIVVNGSFRTEGTNLPQSVDLWYTAEDQAGNVSSSEDRVINVKEEGSYGCTSGIAPNLALDKAISVFPNPSTGVFTVNANLAAPQDVRISVMNMLGQEIAVVHDGNLMNNSFRVDLGSQPSGVYFLNIVSNNQTLTKRIEIAK